MKLYICDIDSENNVHIYNIPCWQKQVKQINKNIKERQHY